MTAEPGARSGPGPLIRALGHTTGVRLPPRVVSEELFEEDLVLIMSPDHALAGRAEVPLADLEDETSAAKGREIAVALIRARFSEVRLETMRLKPAVVCALGVNGAGT